MSARTKRLAGGPVLWAALLLTGSLLAHACGGSSPSGQNPGDQSSKSGSISGPAGHTCLDHHSIEECADYYALRTTLLIDLRDVEGERDQRNVPVGLNALTTGDPLLEAAGLSIVGPFPEEKGVAEAAAKALLSPAREVESLAAAAISENSPYHRLSSQWQRGHRPNGRDLDDPLPPFIPETYKIAVPSNSVLYPLGDSPITAAFATAGTPESVLASLKPPGAPVSLDELSKTLASSAPKLDMKSAMERMKASNNDPKVMASLEAEIRGTEAAATQMNFNELPLPTDDVAKAAQAVILEGKADSAKRWAVVYAEPLYQKTIVIFGWTPGPYPARTM